MRRSSVLPVLVLATLGTMLVPRAANAVVLQIDGTIVPQAVGNIQPGLNKGENGAPYTSTGTPPSVVGAGAKGPINPVFDAAEAPQVFAIPKTNGNFNTVNFIDLLEGAGYENTFGWYNVGDDLSNLANLHPVLTCAGTNYEPTPAGASQLSVNFQTEFAAGRYKGGFVGFFLVTPEGQSNTCSTGNCGNPAESACVGRIYYTEKEINGDGNYVHYLIYQSKRTDASGKRADDFYFGFEDLYRGGDNDFEDMLILAQGLVVPCVPSAEICDGLDNNCDGLVDNNPTDVNVDCYTGPSGTQGKGECKAGKTVCASTGPGNKTTKCVGDVVPTAEVCDGKDNNCNSLVDDAISNLPNACGPQQGSCSAVTQCVGGAPKCVIQKGPQPEICDGLDNDCNGLVDDKLTDTGVPCTPSGNDSTKGECKAGTSTCTNGKLTCGGYQGPTAETCDGKDNDCDGQIDNAPTDLLAKCAPSGITVCTSGAEICLNGAKVCTGFTTPAPEICNGLDDDCNGKVDDDVVDDGAPCGSNVGVCQAGAVVCLQGKLSCSGGQGPSQEICDGLDNDCDGQIDENDPNSQLPEVGDACALGGCSGLKACKNGQILCVGSGGSAEICDGLDNDCNGVIDDNLTDIGALCGNNIGLCKPGTLVCKPKVDGDPTSNQLVCDGGTGPSEEICDGLDNDCDGFVDENPNSLPGIGVDCGGAGCGAGKTSCKDGKVTCQTAGGTGKPEVCNGLDDDCNGLIDDNPIDIDAPCGLSTGECKPGTLACKPKIDGDPTSNQLVCDGGTNPSDEKCDGLDNDCDGQTDEDPDGTGPLVLDGVGVSCSLPGACGSGVQVCQNGALICQSNGQSSPEVCNGLDDDCNGLVDDDVTDDNLPCGTNLGECEQGVSKCVAGKLICEGAVEGSDEVCDGKDNNCNGVVDEDPDGTGPLVLEGVGVDCAPVGLELPLAGECKPGKIVCFQGKLQCLGGVGPTAEACDSKDNDCDGVVDAPNPCPNGAQCIEGQCAQKCTLKGEFDDCPGGLSCIAGFCQNPNAGKAGAGGTAGAAGTTSTGGQAGKGGQPSGGAGGSSGSGTAAAGQSAGGTSAAGASGSGQGASGSGQAARGGVGGSNSNDSNGDGQPDNWGLATGGGGCSCSTAADRSNHGLAAAALALAAGLVRRRRSASSLVRKENA